MSPSPRAASDSIAKICQESYSLLLRSLRAATQTKVAELTCMSDSALSELKTNGHLEAACKVAAACGLRLVPTTERSLSDEHLSALRTLARIGIDGDEITGRRSGDL